MNLLISSNPLSPNMSFKSLDLRNNDPFLSLRWSCDSFSSSCLVDKIFCYLSSQYGYKYRQVGKTRRAVEAYVFGLLSLPSEYDDVWLRRPLSLKSFSGCHVGYKPFMKVHKAFLAAGFVDVKRGFYRRHGINANSGMVTRIRPTASFLSIASEHGLTPLNCRRHFRPTIGHITVRDAVRVRAARSGDWLNSDKGQLLPLDLNNPRVVDSLLRVNRLNEWMSKIEIEGCSLEGFYRLFNQGDLPGFNYDKGGRLYAYGDYQHIKKEERAHIKIDGQPVVEVDVAGSHLTLLHAGLGAPLHSSFDPYDVPGVPREIVKSFILMTLGNGRFQDRWSQPIAKAFTERSGKKLQDAYPLRFTRDAVLKRLPALQLFPNSGITWADLQYKESLGIISTVETLAFEHGVAALPIHDSVIVAESNMTLARIVMTQEFKRQTNVDIRVSIKREVANKV